MHCPYCHLVEYSLPVHIRDLWIGSFDVDDTRRTCVLVDHNSRSSLGIAVGCWMVGWMIGWMVVAGGSLTADGRICRSGYSFLRNVGMTTFLDLLTGLFLGLDFRRMLAQRLALSCPCPCSA